MNSSFDWQTEEENGWEPIEPASRPSPTPHRQPWRVLLLVGVLLGGIALVIHWQFDRRLGTVTAQVEADVLSSHNLINRAAARQDWALLLPLISGRDPAWTNTFGQLVDAGLLYDRPFLTLPLAAPDKAYAPLSPAGDRYRQIVINPEMDTAELHFLQEYEPGAGQETVLLEHIAIYRMGGARWLLSPPNADFWGKWQMIQTKWFTLFYPERDKVMAEQLAEDLTAVLDDVCPQITPLPCFVLRSEFKIWLEPDPATLLALTDPATLYDGDAWLNLPTPTLVGLPTDEAGYQALLRGYSTAITAALITYLAEYECCDHAPFFQVFMEYELSQLGLRPWPVTPATHLQVINQGAYQDDLRYFWQDTSFQRLQAPDGWRLYAFADFIMHQPNAPSPLVALAALGQSRQPVTWLRWLAEVAPVAGFAFPRRPQEWWTYAQAQVAASQGAPPIPMPAQDLLLTCASEDFSIWTLYRYQPANDTWRKEYELGGNLTITPLPDDTAVILETRPRGSYMATLLLWRDGAGSPIVNDQYPSAFTWGETDATGRYLLINAPSAQNEELQTLAADLTDCNETGCELIYLSGKPFWSPNGTQTIITADPLADPRRFADGRVLALRNTPFAEELALFRGDAAGRLPGQPAPPTLNGHLPFWVTNDTYGFVQTTNRSLSEFEQQLVLAATVDDIPHLVLTTADLLAAIPQAPPPSFLSIGYVLPRPGQPEWLALAAGDYLFLVNWRDRIIENRLTTNGTLLGFSPDGRYLVGLGGWAEFVLHDIDANQTDSYVGGASGFYGFYSAYSFDWSADGRWLAHIMDNTFAQVINLVTPGEDYQKLIVHDNGRCSSLAWVNPINR